MMKKKVYIFMIVIYLICIYALMLLPTDILHIITKEDGIIESAGALYFLAASIVLFISYKNDNTSNDFSFLKTKKNFFLLLFSILFFITFGEEISWGQRILGIQTPEMIADVNVQNEINIHNLSIFNRDNMDEKSKMITNLLNVDRLFSIFWFSYCILVPMIFLFNHRIAEKLNKMNLPIVPLSIGLFFIVNYFVSKLLEEMTSIEYSAPIVEIKESNFAFLFFLVAIWFYKTLRYKIATAT